MRQILHIFMKDTRRFWLEILVSLAATCALVFMAPFDWLPRVERMRHASGSDFLSSSFLGPVAFALTWLVPLSWWLLIARVVHAERLVGDRQFWLTRPYEWSRLLAAKALFLLVFIYLPIFAAQCAMLARAGFNPVGYLPGVLFDLMLLTGLIVLPLAALAAVTSTFARLTLTLLGVLVGAIALAALTSMMTLSSFSMPEPIDSWTSFAGIFGGCCAAIVVQYASRQALRARLCLVAIPVLLTISGLIAPDQALMDRTYPPATSPGQSVVQLAYSPVPNVHFTATTTLSSQVGVSVPIRESSAAEGTLIEFEGVRAAIEAPNGERWTSPWQRLDIPKQLPGQNEQSLALFTMPRAVYNRMREMPLKIHLDFAVSLARVSRVTEVRLPLEDFAVPGFGVCAADTGWLGGPDQITGISCRSALRQPTLTYIHVVWSDLSCRTSGQPGADDAGVQGAGWAGSLDRTPANFGVVSVWATNFALSNGSKDLREINTRFLCLGSPLTFTQYELVRRAQAALDIQDFHLPDPPPILPR